jgi:hypothetical protein
MSDYPFAPPIAASAWLNTPAPITLDALRGQVVALHAFQMLCPGCVVHGIPQAQRLGEAFAGEGLVVLGLHSVFEHHAVMGPDALAAFVHEYRLAFPIAIDEAVPGSAIPRTMQRYQLRGTPSLVLIDRDGRVRANLFGRPDDLRIGALIGRLLAEPIEAASPPADGLHDDGAPGGGCDDQGCRIG